MSVTIDSLDIQIKSSAGSAADNIDKLADALGRLKTNASLTKVTNNLGKLGQTLDGLKGTSNVLYGIEALSKAMQSLSTIQKPTGLNSTITTLKKLPEVFNNLSTGQLDLFEAKVKRLATALEPLADKIDRVATGFNRLPSQVSKTVTAVNRLDSANKKAAKSTESLDHQSANLFTTFENFQNITGIINQVADGFNRLTQSAIEWDGVEYQFGNTFGEEADKYYDYVQKVTDVLGINKQTFMENSAMAGSMLIGFGVNDKDARTMGVGYTELAYDIWAAFNNVYKSLEGADGAMAAVRSAIAGEVEPIRRAGFTIVESTLEQTAANHGLEISIEKATESQKSYLRYLSLVDQAHSKGIVGTYAREMDTAEGAIRRLSQQIKTLTQTVGSLFIPMLQMAIPWVTAFVSILTDGARAVAAFFGIEIQKIDWSDSVSGVGSMAENAQAATDGLGGAAKAAKKLRSYTMGFDELNVIDPTSGSGGSGGAAGVGGAGFEGLDVGTLWDQALLDQASQQVDELKQKIQDYMEEHKTMLTIVGSVAGFLGFMKVLRGLNSLFGVSKTIDNLRTAFEKLGNSGKKTKDFFKDIKDFFKTAKQMAPEVGWLKALFPKTAMTGASISEWVTGTFLPAAKKVLKGLPRMLANAVRAIPGWGWVIGAIASVLALAIVDFDFTDIGYKLGHALGSVIAKAEEWLGAASEWITGVGEAIMTGLGNAWDWVKEEFDINSPLEAILLMINPVALVTKMVPKLIEIGAEVLPGIWQGIQDGWNNFWGNIEEFIDGFIQGWKDALGIHSPSTVFAEIGTNLIAGLLNGVTKKWEDIKRWFKTAVAPKLTLTYWIDQFSNLKAGFVQTIKNMLNAGIDLINKFIGWLNEKMNFSWEAVEVMGKEVVPAGSVQLFTIPPITQRFADGGFIEDGLFTMNRGEIAGKFSNGKSVVANNEQIVDGIAAGVYQAVVQAMSEIQRGDQSVNVYLDGKQIYSSVKKTESERGRTIMGNQLGYAY